MVEEGKKDEGTYIGLVFGEFCSEEPLADTFWLDWERRFDKGAVALVFIKRGRITIITAVQRLWFFAYTDEGVGLRYSSVS